MKRKMMILSMLLAGVVTLGVPSMNVEAADATTELNDASLGWTLYESGEQAAYETIIYYGGNFSPGVIENLMDAGYLLDYVDDLKALGYIDADYNPPGSSATTAPSTEPAQPAAEPTPAPTPEPFTVEPIEPSKTMWATNEVNLREGASTQYTKVGALEQYEEVNVTGQASTGWYQITKEDGTVCYVSNSYLTEEDPHNRTEYIYDENEEVVKKYEFTDVEPEVIDEVVAEIKEESKLEEEPETEAVEEETNQLPTWVTVVFIVMLCLLGIFMIDSVYRIIKSKKEEKNK